MPIDTELFGGYSFRVGDTTFRAAYGESTVDSFCVLKTQAQIESFLGICRRFSSGSIVELGIAAGGSTALLALAAEPRKLVAIDLDTTPVAALHELIARGNLEQTVRPHYGIDQADRDGLRSVVHLEFGDEPRPLDLVIDDASHLLAPTTASFETLFPYLRAGGLYVLEDWNSAHLAADGIGSASKGDDRLRPPLTPLIMELLLLRASSGGIVQQITVGDLWVAVERGPAPLDPRHFRVRRSYVDHFDLAAPSWHEPDD